jgi:putative SOS response-associated peptidase YedK
MSKYLINKDKSMCGRYNLYNFKNIKDRFNIDKLDIELHENYNIAPSQLNPVVTRNSPNKIEMMKWGFIPFWAKDENIGFKMINARAETLNEKPAFKKSLEEYRCLVPANGFYEWKETKEGKIPYLIKMKDDSLFSFAGLFSTRTDTEGKDIKSYTIITTSPNELMKNIHNRMPVILSKDDEDIWLDKNTEVDSALKILEPYDGDDLMAYKISSDVNSPRNNNKDLLNNKND